MMNRVEQIFLISVGLGVGYLHWHFYVKPADELRYCAMECMGQNSDLESYKQCVQEIESGSYLCE